MNFENRKYSRDDKQSRNSYQNYKKESKKSSDWDRNSHKRLKSTPGNESFHSQFPTIIQVPPRIDVSIITSSNDATAAATASRQRGFSNFKFGTRLQNASNNNNAPLYSAKIDKNEQLAETREFTLDDKATMILALGDRISPEMASCEFILRIISLRYTPDGSLHYVEMNYKDYKKLVLHESDISRYMRRYKERQILRTENISVRTQRYHSNDIYVSIKDRHDKVMHINSWVMAKLLGLANEIEREYLSFVKKMENATTRSKMANNFIAFMLNEENLNDSIELPILNSKSDVRSFEAIKRTLETLWKQLGKIAYNK